MMSLTLDNKENINFNSFVNYITLKIRTWILNNVNYTELKRWNDFFRSNDLGWPKYNGKTIIPSAQDIIAGSAYHLKYKRNQNSYTIEIDPKAKIKDTNLNYATFASLINYGNLSMPAYPIFTKAFQYADDNLSLFVKEFFG